MNLAAMCRHAMEAIFNPFSIGLVLFAFLLFWLCCYGDSRLLRAGLFIVLIGFLLFSTAWLPQILIKRLENQYPVITKTDPNVHWVVVFGGGQLSQVHAPANHLLNDVSIKRLVEGVRLYRLLPETKLIVSGGGEVDEIQSEAAHAAILASWFGIPREHVVVESRSINTADEAIAIKQWVHQEPFYLVTSSLHMPRSMALCRKQALNPIAAPSDYPYDEKRGWRHYMVPQPINLVYASVAWHEMLGWAWGVVTRKI